MSPRSWQERVQDILGAITSAQSYVAGMSAEEFAADLKTIHAAAFEIAVVGEAARHIPADVRLRFPEVPWSLMQNMRNAIIHEYFRIETATLWSTLEQDLPSLVIQLRRLLDEEE